MPVSRCSIAFILGCLLATNVSRAQSDWIQTAGPPGGRVWQMEVRANATVFVIQEGFLSRSLDGGATWHRIATGFRVNSLALDDGASLRIATASGIFRSDDDGETWTPSGLQGRSVNKVTYSPTHGWFVTTGYPVTMFRSEDGMTWSVIPTVETSGFPLRFVQAMPSGRVFAGSGPSPFDGGFFYEWSNNEWIQIPRIGLVDGLSESPDGDLYVAREERLWGSAGLNRVRNVGQLTQTEEDIQPPGARSIGAVTVGAESDVYAGSWYGVFWSDDKGKSWIEIGDLRLSTSVLTLVDTTLYAGTGVACAAAVDWVPGQCISAAGLFRWTGGVWQHVPVPDAGSSVAALASDTSGTIYALGAEGAFQTNDQGVTWQRSVPYQGADQALYDVANTLTVTADGIMFSTGFLSHFGGGRFAPGDTSWTEDFAPLSVVDLVNGILVGGRKTGPYAEGGVYRSEDGGVTWTLLDSLETSILVPGVNQELYAGTEGGVYHSVDGGETWMLAGLEGKSVERLWSGRDGRLVATTDGSGQFYSEDNGETWSGLSTAGWLIDVAFADAGRIFAVTTAGVFYSFDWGGQWVSSGEFTDYQATSIILGKDGHLYVGTHGQGVYRSRAPARLVANEPEIAAADRIAVLSSYPNPFSQSTTISFSLEQPSDIELEIFDLLGRRVASLASGQQQAGSHDIVWAPIDTPSGVYLLKLEAERVSLTRLVMLVR